MEQRQQQQQLNPGVINAIACLEDPSYRGERHKLIVTGYEPPVDRQSWEHLVDFLDDTESHEVTELKLLSVHLESDGSLEVLRTFFARSDTTLTKVELWKCKFGTAEDTSHLLAAFQSNRTVSDLRISTIRNNLEGAALGTCLSSLSQNMPQLQRLDCSYSNLRVEGVRAFQPALQENRTLKKLILDVCYIGNDGIRLIADALDGNATIDMLDIADNKITHLGLPDITRLIESTRLKMIDFAFGNFGIFDDEDATQHFVSTLQHTKSSVQELPQIYPQRFPGDQDSKVATLASINNSLTRNQQLNRLNLLLAPPPPQQQQNHHGGAAMMMFKTWHKAITKFAMIPNNAGASAIFKLFTARPQLLEMRRLKRPAAATASISQEQQKRRRL